ncbi:MAG: hypothetical protein AAF764_07350 [Pseudomonadota bacterium]
MSVIDWLSWIGITQPDQIARSLPGLFSLFAVFAGGTVAGLGWWFKQWLNRREQRNDMRRAIYAEIFAQWGQLFAYSKPETIIPLVVEKIEVEPLSYTPYVANLPEAVVLSSLLDNISVLGAYEIPSVFAYIHHMNVARASIADLRGDAYSRLTKDQRVAVMAQYVNVLFEAQLYAQGAMTKLETALRMPIHKRYRHSNIWLSKVTPWWAKE